MRVRARMGAGVFFGLVLLIFFNNCNGQVRFGGSGGFTSTRLDSGNGGGYGGKPDGTFYHLVPEFSCERQEAAMGIMAISTAGVTYVENSRLQCDAARTDIDPDLIDASPFHNQLVGYQDMIFERKDTEVTKIPNRLVEAWCFDDPVEKNLEIIAQYDRVTRRATSTVYRRSSGTNVDLVSGVAVSRLVSIDSVHYQGAQYDLVVDKTSPARIVGQFNGQFKGAVAGQALDIGVNCRLGGYLDARLWPAKALSTEMISRWEYFSVTNQVFAQSVKRSTTRFLSRIDLPQLTETPLTPVDPPFRGILDFKVAPEKNLALVTYDGTGAYRHSLYAINLATLSMTQLSGPITSSAQLVYGHFTLSASGQTVFYKDGTQQPNSEHVGQWLRSAPTDGSSPPTQLSHSLPLNGQFSVFNFVLSDPLNHLAYIVSSIENYPHHEVWSVRTDGSNDRRISPDLPDAIGLDLMRALKFVGTNRLSVLYHAADKTNPDLPEPVTIISHLDGSGSTIFRGHLEGRSDSDDTLEFVAGQTESSNPRLLYFTNQIADGGFLYDVDTEASMQTPYFSKLLFLRNSTQMIGVRGRDVHLVEISTRADTKICTMNGTPLNLLQTLQSVIMTVLTDNGMLLYRIENGTCNEFGSLPGNTNYNLRDFPWNPTQIKISPDEKSVALICDINGDTGDDLIWIPLDGRAPVKVNHPLVVTQSVNDVYFTSDSSSLIFSGDLIESNKPFLYLWKIPQ